MDLLCLSCYTRQIVASLLPTPFAGDRMERLKMGARKREEKENAMRKEGKDEEDMNEEEEGKKREGA